jgi:hypothetical protein
VAAVSAGGVNGLRTGDVGGGIGGIKVLMPGC